MKMSILWNRSAISRMLAVAIAVIIIVAAVVAGVYYVTLPSPSPSPSSSPSPSPSSSPSPSPSSSPSSLTVLHVNRVNAPTLDPAVGSDYAAEESFIDLYDTLVYPTTAGSANPVQPEIATSWNGSTDGMTYTFYLRQGVRFHDGSELTANDVVFSMNRLLTIGGGEAYLFTPYVNTTVAIDNFTVQFNMKQSDAVFVPALVRFFILEQSLVMAHIVTPGAYGALGDYGENWLLTHDAGSGPYELVTFMEGSYVLMQKSPYFWGTYVTNAPDEVEMTFNTDPTFVLTSFADRNMEITDEGQTPQALATLATVGGVNLTRAYLTVWYMMIDTQRAPMSDIHFRAAMAYCFNYSEVSSVTLPGSVAATGPVTSQVPGADPNCFQPTYNVTEAKIQLQESAFYANLSDYTVHICWCSEVPYEELVATQLAADMEAIGINTAVVATPWLTYVADTASKSTSPDVMMVQLGADYPEAIATLYAKYDSASAGTWEQNEWIQNSTIDSEMSACLADMNQTQRYADEAMIQNQIAEYFPDIFVCQFAQTEAYQAYYMNYPLANGIHYTIAEFDWAARFISIYPNLRQAELANPSISGYG